MKKLPRALNRILLFILGLLSLAGGILLIATPLSARIRTQVLYYGERLQTLFTSLNHRSRFQIQGWESSWLQLGTLAIAVIVIVALLIWIFVQGGGKIRSLALNEAGKDTQKQGEITAELGLIRDIIEDEVSASRWISSMKIQSWEVKKRPGLLVTAAVYKGANPQEIKTELDKAIAKLDQVLGIKMPILVRLTTNWRSNIGSANRVDS